MSKWIDADAFVADSKWCGLETAEQVLFALDHQPSIDIVRCKECKHNYNTAINHGKMQPRCDFTDWKLTENDYCSRGERKESE